MKILLAAINAKYIHSNPAIHSLRSVAADPDRVELGEYTINHNTESVRADIYRRRPDVLAFSCYIWNIPYVRHLVKDLSRLLPDMQIWLGGPEVSWHGREILDELPMVKGIMVGSGEDTFARLTRFWEEPGVWSLEEIPGLIYRDIFGSIRSTGMPHSMLLDDIPFWYEDLSEFENRIIYYESSRGCPFRCSYCLSSIEKDLQFRNPERVCRELQFFLDRKVPQVKFIDRTFNCRESHALTIWRYIAEHDNGITNFHFEIAADLLTEAEMQVLETMRPGLVQLEIGVQSTNPRTVKEIRRVMDLQKVAAHVARINAAGNIHQHLDLIAGLPYEDYESFGHSFDDVYAMKPEQLQLGFLKVLKGAYMEQMTEEYGLLYTQEVPYEVLATRWLPYEDVLRLKGIEEMVEMFYNSGQFTHTLQELEHLVERPFLLYERLAGYWAEKGYSSVQSSRVKKYQILLDFACALDPEKGERFRECLILDAYLREHMKNRPDFGPKQRPEDWELWKDFLHREAAEHNYLPELAGMGYRELLGKLHGEILREGILSEGQKTAELAIFDYTKRDPLSGNARILILSSEELEAYASKK